MRKRQVTYMLIHTFLRFVHRSVGVRTVVLPGGVLRVAEAVVGQRRVRRERRVRAVRAVRAVRQRRERRVVVQRAVAAVRDQVVPGSEHLYIL